jgi:hypothetical protein
MNFIPWINLSGLFTTALLSQLQNYLTTSQLSSLLIKISEFKPENILDNPQNLITTVSKKYNLLAQLPNLSKWLKDENIQKAREKATNWLRNGIFLLLPVSSRKQEILFAQGDPTILNFSKATVLNSRKGRFITPLDSWLQVTKRLTEEAIMRNFTFVSSLGMLTYEVVTFIAKKNNSKMIIVLDEYLPGVLSEESEQAFYNRFHNIFDLKNTLFISPFFPEVKLPPRRQRMALRDYWVVELADYIFIAEARAEGNIQRLASEALSQGRKVIVFQPQRFSPNTKGNQKLLATGAEEIVFEGISQSPVNKVELKLSEEATSKLQADFSEYLFHYTRACPGPWPKQSLAEYIQSLIEGEPDASHTAFDTLCRILNEGIIRASDWFVRVKVPVVSFSKCPPDELSKIRKWNPALIRWTFEPYGIGIRKSILERMGAKPVIYAPEHKFKEISENERFRFQLHQPPKTDWAAEKEWRIPGDVILKDISSEDIIIIVPTKREAAVISAKFMLKKVYNLEK